MPVVVLRKSVTLRKASDGQLKRGVTLEKKPQVIPDSWSLWLRDNALTDFAMFLAMRPVSA